MIWKKPKKITPGHYKPPRLKLPGLSNMPAPGRPSKSVPQLKKLGVPKMKLGKKR